MRKVILILSLFLLCSFVQEDSIVTKASWYGGHHHGRKTASGEVYNMNDYTGAHKTLKFGTKLRVKNLRNGKEVIIRINDRGPFIKGRDLDLSRQSFKDLDDLNRGVLNITYSIIE